MGRGTLIGCGVREGELFRFRLLWRFIVLAYVVIVAGPVV